MRGFGNDRGISDQSNACSRLRNHSLKTSYSYWLNNGKYNGSETEVNNFPFVDILEMSSSCLSAFASRSPSQIDLKNSNLARTPGLLDRRLQTNTLFGPLPSFRGIAMFHHVSLNCNARLQSLSG
jgi:hypothetical protein